MNKFTFKSSWKHIFDALTKHQKGELIDIILNFIDGVEVNVEDDVIRVAFAPIKAELEQEIQKRIRISEKRRAAGRKGGLKSGVTRKKKSKSTTKMDFVAPNLVEIKNFIETNSLNVDALEFFNHYTKYEWKIKGKTMDNWEETVLFWHQNPRGNSKNKVLESKNYLT